MNISELIILCTEELSKNGDKPVNVDLLTCNSSNFINITGWDFYDGKLNIQCDINNIKKFKKDLK